MNILENSKCTYCGASAECKEHVIPVAYLSIGRSYDPEKCWIVPACNSCNNLAGVFVAFSISEKAKYITKKFKLKYKRILNAPEWTEDEMNEMDYNLKTMIWGGLVAKRMAYERLKQLEITSNFAVDYERPKFIETQIMEATEVWNIKVKNKKRKYIRKNKDLTHPVNQITKN
jgi:hypothetical protein